MVAMVKCDQCGKVEEGSAEDRNHTFWPWYLVRDPTYGDGRRFDLCSAKCLMAWASESLNRKQDRP